MSQHESNRRARLLVVDDQEANLKIVGAFLHRFGFEIVLAADAEQALASLRKNKIDLVLLDVIMPGQDGFALCSTIKAEPAWADIPVIFLSAADDKGLIVQAFESGGVDYVTKPFNQAELQSRVQTHLALKHARDRLKQLAEDKDEILGILAHDLKDHLSSIRESTETLASHAGSQNDERIQRMAALIQSATLRMLSFVDEFLANASADRGFVFNLESVCLRQVATDVSQRYADIARRKDITLHLSGSAPAPVLADHKALDQILDNLVSNAIKFSESGKSVRVGVESYPDGAVCRVQDEGPGFSDEDMTRLFHRYQRLSAMPTGGEPSSGLGLSIVKKLVDAMQGSITCESRPGAGTTFSITLPAPGAAA